MATCSEIITEANTRWGTTSNPTNLGSLNQTTSLRYLQQENNRIVNTYGLDIFKTLTVKSLIVSKQLTSDITAGDTTITLNNVTGIDNTTGMGSINGSVFTFTGVSGSDLTGIPASGKFSIPIDYSTGDTVEIFIKLPTDFNRLVENETGIIQNTGILRPLPSYMYDVRSILNDGTNQFLWVKNVTIAGNLQIVFQQTPTTLTINSTPDIPGEKDQYEILSNFICFKYAGIRNDERLTNFQMDYEDGLEEFLNKYDARNIETDHLSIYSPY